MKLYIAATLAATLVYVAGSGTSVADAQGLFGQLQKLAGAQINPGAQQGNEVLTAAGFYGQFLAARLEMNQAQIELAEAFELKDQVTLLQTEQTRLKGGALDANGLRESTVLSNNVNVAIEDKIRQKTVLSKEGRAHYQAGIPYFLIGGLLTYKLIGEGEQAVRSSSLADKIALVAVLKDVVPFAKSVGSCWQMVLTFGKENNIQMPANASDALGTLGG